MTAAILEHLRVDHASAPLAIERTHPRFSWQVVALNQSPQRIRQEYYRIKIYRDDPGRPMSLVADSDIVRSSDCIVVTVPDFRGVPGQEYRWRLQVWLSGEALPLEATDVFGIAKRDWGALWAEPAQQPVTVDGPAAATKEEFAKAAVRAPVSERLHPPRLLRQEFELASTPLRARLRVTSQGINHTTLNGNAVSDQLFAPGYDAYNLVTPVVTYDVTSLLRVGTNALGMVLGDGWFAGRISFLGRSAQYGDVLRASWELDIFTIDGSHRTLRPDQNVVSSRGPIEWSDLFIGERFDARKKVPGWDRAGFDAMDWTPVRLRPFTEPIRPFIGEPVRRLKDIPAEKVWQTSPGTWVIDFGQVIAGRVKMSVRGQAGTLVRLEHSEVVTPEGEFVQNILGVNKDQTDEYVLEGSASEVWEPLLTFHGFRYVRVTGYPGEAIPNYFTAVVIGDDLESTAEFRSSDSRLNRLFSNVVWSQRSNFLAVPTDCPQRERAGYTGDINIFAPTAATLMGVAGVLERWLAGVRLEQTSHGGIVPVVSPEPPAMAMGLHGGNELSKIKGAAGWADAITTVPWALWEHYGDDRFLRDNLQAMRDWVAVQTREATDQLPKRLQGIKLSLARRQRQELLWNGGFHFGDWVTPSTMIGTDDIMEAVLKAPRLTSELVAPMYQVRSLDLFASALTVLGEDGEADNVRAHAKAVRDSFTAEYLREDGQLEPDLQGMYVLALAFKIVPAEREAQLVEHLVRLIHKAEMHLDTGFLSTPHLLDVLSDHGRSDIARALLWQDTMPSWLYEVRMGATTIWESWDAIGEDGRAKLTSMNHYAFGCVGDWIIRRQAGIIAATPGYRTARLSPDLDGPLDWVEAHVETPYGRLGVTWRRESDRAEIVVQVPVGVSGTLDLADNWEASSSEVLSPGRHVITARRLRLTVDGGARGQ